MTAPSLSVAVAVLLLWPVALRAQDDGALVKAAVAKATERRAELQKKLAAGSSVQRQFRLDGFAGGQRIKIVGVFLEPAPDRARKTPPLESLQDELRELVKREIKDVTNGRQLLFDFSGITRLERDDRLFARLQSAIAVRPALDGVRVDAGAKFGPGGEFLLTGVRPKLDAKQAEALERDVGECFRDVLGELANGRDAAADRYKQLRVGPVASAASMTEADTRKILADLREWAKATRDDVRLSRLYFGPDGGLKLLCEAPTDQDVDEVRAKLKELAPEYYPKARGPAAPPAEAKELWPEPFVRSSTIPAFTPFLRKQLAADPKKRWGAVLIDRGFFDENNLYTLRGVIDRPAQKAELSALVESFATSARWKLYFADRPKGARVNLALDAIPMEDLVARVRRVTPAYAVFDGIAVASARYDPDATLVFTAQVAGKPKLAEARLALANLMTQHPDYARRLAKPLSEREPKLRIDPLPAEEAASNNKLAEFSVASAAIALAKEDTAKAQKWIETGILHYPHDPSVWFLSAYYHLLLNDRELVRRDLFRLIEVEVLPDSPQRKRRFEVTKEIQGQKRDELDKIWQECWKELKDAKDGVKPITLAAPK